MMMSAWQLLLLSFALIFCIGMAAGSAFTIRITELRGQAEKRRQLDAEWEAIHAAEQQAQEPSDDELHGGVTVADPSGPLAWSSAKNTYGPSGASASGSGSGAFQESPDSRKLRWYEGSSKGDLILETLPITIYLSDEAAHEQVEAAVEDLIVAAGGRIEHRDDPVLGSWFRRMRAKVGRLLSSPLGHEITNLAAHAAEAHLVHAQDATVTATMLQNLGPVLLALQPTKEAVIRAGALLIVKMDSTLVVHQLTATQQLQLDHQPQLAQSPHDILSALQLRLNSSTQSTDAIDSVDESMTAPRSLIGNTASTRVISSNGAQASTPNDVTDQQMPPETNTQA
jgi:hypothetical protein